LDTLEKKHPEVLETFKAGKLTDEAKETCKKVADELSGQFN
jgi:hypothetical protein